MTSLELAVRFGKTLVIQEVDGVEPILYPVLRKDFTSQGPRFVVQIGEKGVDYNENFRFSTNFIQLFPFESLFRLLGPTYTDFGSRFPGFWVQLSRFLSPILGFLVTWSHFFGMPILDSMAKQCC